MDQYLDKSYWNGLIKMSISKLFILRVLYEGPLHGYGISKRIHSVTSGCCAPTEGALYPVLREFEKGGYVTCQTEKVGGRDRKVYTLTSKGEEAYYVGLESWQETAKVLLEAKRDFVKKS